jgi:hypothetical protein
MLALNRSTQCLRFRAGLESQFVLPAFAMRPTLEAGLALTERRRELDPADIVLVIAWPLGSFREEQTLFTQMDDG